MIYVVNKKWKLERIQKEFPDAIILDITSTSDSNYAKWLSPFYPHGNIPIPGDSHGMVAECVEGIWQGLKVFESEGICMASFKNRSMKGLKRTIRSLGKPMGHQFGIYSSELLSYLDARIKIYLPTYKYVLDNVSYVHDVIERIRIQSTKTDIVLLDYNTNTDYLNVRSPLSHAGLVKLYIEGNYPDLDNQNDLPNEDEVVAQTNRIPSKLSDKRKRRRKSKSNEDLQQELSIKWDGYP